LVSWSSGSFEVQSYVTVSTGELPLVKIIAG
jgi:hypothetical protein